VIGFDITLCKDYFIKKEGVIMNGKSTLNILNGQSMYDHFKQKHLDENGTYIPFNEAMCVGGVTTDIFSNEFNEYRCEAHHVTMDEYHELTLEPLKIFIKGQFSNIVLWFDDDMFCQINLLTILAYLDQINYSREVNFKLVNREFKVVHSFELRAQGYDEIYKQIMVNRCIPQNINLSVMKNGVTLYLNYLKEENEITAYIRKYEHLKGDTLVEELLKMFPQYGLGDTQYADLIEKYRKSN
jgi:hypothetical protein